MPKHLCFLIDDDDDDREIFQLALEEIGIPVELNTARNGKDALMRLSDQSFVPDSIFLDVNMPLMTGEECLVQIRERDHLRNVEVFMYTTSADENARQRFISKGATDTVTKCDKFSELVALLKQNIK